MNERQRAKLERELLERAYRPKRRVDRILHEVGQWTLTGMFLFFIVAALVVTCLGGLVGYLLAQ